MNDPAQISRLLRLMGEDIARIETETSEVAESTALLQEQYDEVPEKKHWRALKDELEATYTGVESLLEKAIKCMEITVPLISPRNQTKITA